MGYTTEFTGRFNLDKALKAEHAAYLTRFADTRRMKRNATLLMDAPDPLRQAVALPLGTDGGYFVGAAGYGGQDHSADIIDYNSPPRGQPGLWCQWQPTADGKGIEWNGGEKFYDYSGWLTFIIEHFLSRWGYSLSGEVDFQGEDPRDRGTLSVIAEKVRVTTLRVGGG